MKKLAVILLTVSALMFSTSALAENVTSATLKTGSTKVSGGTTLGAMESEIPCFSTDCVLKFDAASLPAGQLTLISYKYNETTLDNAVVQYINQYTISASETKEITYKIRNTTDGIYKLALNANNGEKTWELYYKVANPEVTTETTKMVEESTMNDGTYVAGFAGQIKLDNSDVTLADAGITQVGFDLTANGATKSQTKAVTEMDLKDIESGGAVTLIFGIEVHGIDTQTNGEAITATAKTNEITKVEVE